MRDLQLFAGACSANVVFHDRQGAEQARFTYILELSDGKRTTTRGMATEIFVRENGRWVNPFWYLQ
jgi:uncharacterized protein YdeI (YjbR/CyaY-like superfamily)